MLARPCVFASGGGMQFVSTADDLLAFGRMMLNGGAHGTGRILSRLSVEAMTTDQLTPGQFGRDGAFSTSLYVDPHQDLVGVLMAQCRPAALRLPPVVLDFWTSVYQAIDD